MNQHTQSANHLHGALREPSALRACVTETVFRTRVFDMHTHLFAPQFGALNLWGIDELLTYHYLIAELMRAENIAPRKFFALSKGEQADLVWHTLFIERAPLSEATRGIIRALTALDLNPRAKDLREARAFFANQKAEDFLNRVFEIACVSGVVMTNDPLDAAEAGVWNDGGEFDSRFHAALRMDRLLNGWREAVPHIKAQGFSVQEDLSAGALAETRRFLDAWIERMKPLYLAVSLPDTFAFPEDSARSKLISEVVLPACREHDKPLAMMIGVRRRVNPELQLAGDALGRADITAVTNLCAAYPDNRFLVTMLARENQHELCVAARKFGNLMPFGCWWFLNNPSIISEVTRERFELLGASFIPQHSDARVLDQLIYKWEHSRRVIADALYESFKCLMDNGWFATPKEIEQEVTRLFSGNFRQWVGLETKARGGGSLSPDSDGRSAREFEFEITDLKQQQRTKIQD
ncbi:MAG: glucuronate isomerase [Pyrinomonadaceae bacterium]|nr:glucuronate isomerase [Pyrinomonadaceae bacterium]